MTHSTLVLAALTSLVALYSFTETISLANPTPTPGSVPASNTNHEESRYYVEQIKAMKDYELTTLYVDMLHLLEREEVLARAIRSQYYRLVKVGFEVLPTPFPNDSVTASFLPYLRRAIQALVRRYAPTYLYISTSANATATSRSAPGSSSNPALVTRDFNIAFYNMPLVNSIRDLKMDKIGQLMSISGTVTRTSEVRPELVAGTFRCEVCKTIISDVEQQFKFTEVRDFSGKQF